jgi:hypothetical protein
VNPPDKELIRAMRAAFDHGVTWVDTAEAYGAGLWLGGVGGPSSRWTGRHHGLHQGDFLAIRQWPRCGRHKGGRGSEPAPLGPRGSRPLPNPSP